MNAEDVLDVFIWIIGTIIIGFVVFVAVYGTVNISSEKACLALGWPSTKVDVSLNAYCVKRVDQTDIVVPLRELESQK